MLRNKYKIVLLLLLTFITSMAGISNVNAETDRIRKGAHVSGGYYYTHYRETGATHWLWDELKFLERVSDGAFVYCVQHFATINSDATYEVTTEDMNEVANITYENWKIIEKIAYYGYGYNENGINHTEDKWYPATQMLIWKYTNPNIDSHFTVSLGGAIDDSILADEMREIMDLVNRHLDRPVFNDIPSEIVIGDTITINDSKGVLSNYTIDNIKGGNVNKNGNSLNITPTEVGEISFNLNKMGNRYGEPTKLYYAIDSQSVVRRGNIDPIRVPIKIRTIGGTVTPVKYDSETLTDVPQGEATLIGAVYGIYKEDGTKVGTVTSGGVSDYLPSLGRFYLLEEIPSHGYLLDKNKYYFDITLDNLNPRVQVFETVISLDFDFIKVYADNKTGVMKPEIGIKFGVYNNLGEEVKILTTDSQGSIKFKLPYGTYTLKQLTTSQGHEKAEDMILEVRETGSTIKKVIANANITAKLKVIKVDKDSGKVIERPNIMFKIYDLDRREFVSQTITYPTPEIIDVFKTDKNGVLITPYALKSGTYQLIEVDQIIDKYLWNSEPITFTIDENTDFTIDKNYGVLVVIEFPNKEVKGSVDITKLGEEIIIEDNTFHYKEIKLDGVVYELYANEDIISGDNTLVYKKDELIGTYKTKNGFIEINNLYLGKYYLLEKSSIGTHILDTTKHEFELSYIDQYTGDIHLSFTYKNYLSKGTYEFTKTDFITGKPLPNTKINIFTNNEGEEQRLIFEGYTDEFGKIIIKDLFVSKFVLYEVEAPEGYVINTDPMEFEIKENGEIIKSEMTNEKISSIVKIHKVDESGNPIKGVTIGIYDLEDNLLFSGITDEFGDIEFVVEYGSYYFKEISTLNEFELSYEKIYFDVKNNGEYIQKTLVNELKEIEIPNTSSNSYISIISIFIVIIGFFFIIIPIKRKNNI